MRDNRSQFISLVLFMVVATLVLSNGFALRIFAQGKSSNVFQEIAPIGDVLYEIEKGYVEEPEFDKIVEGAIVGMMNSLDEHSSYIPAKALQFMTEETDGSFEGIGVTIQLNEEGQVSVAQPIPGAPATKAGIMAGDIIHKIDDVTTKGMSLDEARDLIRGPRGTTVRLTILRRDEEGEFILPPPVIEIKRGKIPLESLEESRMLEGGIGYIRISDFKKTTETEVAERIDELKNEGMKSLILDLRWNPGGLLNAAPALCELFLPENTLVTYTKGRNHSEDGSSDVIEYRTKAKPIVPDNLPMVVLVNEHTASSSEIVTGALQFWSRAIVVGVKTYGKGSVQTIIPLKHPANSAIRLTTALYYTPAEVTIHKHGILPDVEAPMSEENSARLWLQLLNSYRDDLSMRNQQNHGAVTGNEMTEETINDTQLQRAIEVINDAPAFSAIVAHFHKDPHETQVAASDVEDESPSDEAAASDDVSPSDESDPSDQAIPSDGTTPSGGAAPSGETTPPASSESPAGQPSDDQTVEPAKEAL